MDNGKMDYFGGDMAFSMAGAKTLDEEVKEQAIKSFNEANKKQEEAIKADIDKKLEKGKEIIAKAQSMEIMPNGSYLLVRPYAENPFQAITQTDSGIIIPTFDGTFQNPDTGEEDKMYNISMQADVLEVGPLVKYVRPGDVVYYREACQVPVPFFQQNLHVVAENQIHVIINENIKKRFEEIKNGEQ